MARFSKSDCVLAAMLVLALPFSWGFLPGFPDDMASGWGVAVQGVPLRAAKAQWSASVLREVDRVVSPNESLEGIPVRVAVVDTGADPRVLGKNSTVDWIDLTGEGVVRTSEPLSPGSQGLLYSDGRAYDVSGIPSKSGRYRAGVWRPQTLPGGSPVKSLFGEGAEIYVLVTDFYVKDQYDTVYIDTNCNGSFKDEQGLEVFRNSHGHASVRSSVEGRTLTVVLCDIEDNGGRITLGFDGNGHGTRVASVIAGSAPDFSPVAPESRMIVVKAIDSSGKTRWDLLAKGVLEACQAGARVIVISAAPIGTAGPGSQFEDAIEKAGTTYGALVVIAAGNSGPGLGTLPDYAGRRNVITAGGYIPRAMEDGSGLSSGSVGSLWPWASIGPTSDGHTVSLLAPALAPALVPAWAGEPGTTEVFEGTSCSAAYAGGAAALLGMVQTKRDSAFSAQLVKAALEDGALPLAEVQAVEQGRGLLQIQESLRLLVESEGYRPNIRLTPAWGGKFHVGGFFDRERIPGYIPLGVDSFTPLRVSLEVTSPPWLKVGNSIMSIPAVDQRETFVRVDPGLSSGLWSGYVFGDDPAFPGTDFEFLVTVAAPRRFGESGFLVTQKILAPGKLHREYIRVEPGQEQLAVSLDINKAANGEPRGRAKYYLYDPSGNNAYESSWLGTGARVASDEAVMNLPAPGVWEVVVLADPESAAFGADDLSFKLSLSRRGVAVDASPVFLTTQAGSDTPSATGEVQILNAGTEFRCVPLAISPGVNGEVVSERVTATSMASLAKSLPRIGEGTRFLYLSASQPDDASAEMDMFLYYHDRSQGRWVEVGSAGATGFRDKVLAIKNPMPGQYVAYIDARNLEGDQTTFNWTCVVAKESPGYRVGLPGSDERAFLWPENEYKALNVSVPSNITSPQQPATVYLTLWDENSGMLRAFCPAMAIEDTPSPVVYVGQGASLDKGRVVTVFARDPRTLKPIDALVCLDGIWYQLRNGQATVVVNRTTLDGLVIVAEYPGMYPRVKTIRE